MLSNVGGVSSKVSPVASPAEDKAVEDRFAIHSCSPLGNKPVHKHRVAVTSLITGKEITLVNFHIPM